jgi:hypothetical protein
MSTEVTTYSAPLERSAPGKAPSAFLIWPAGEVTTDLGVFRFTERSAQLLLADQASKGLKYPFDLNHWSLDPKAPPASSCAVGWHSIDVRDGALWAIDCEWSPEIRQGLEAQPPRWRYYSPVFNANPETREIIKYLGCAIVNTPATHGATDLALAANARNARNAELPLTLGAPSKVHAAGFRPDNGHEIPDGLSQLVAGLERMTPSSKQTPEEIAKQRDNLDRQMRLGAYAPGAPPRSSGSPHVYVIGSKP